ncbi:MAG: CBS domain-containing protein [Planctomycetaceae bacterium]|nr:CBS domain-containing protein [Planctomycetaceae bacterium]
MRLVYHVVTADEIMRRNLVTLGPETPVLDGIALMLRHNISGMPVVDRQQNYLGVFSEKSCFRALSHMIEAAGQCGMLMPHVHEFMNRQVVYLTPEMDVFDGIEKLLSRRISGAPVLDEDGRYLGIFSEKTAMTVVVHAIYDHVPSSQVSRFMNVDHNRVIDGRDSLFRVATIFLNTAYRRLPVLRDDHLAGQVSRRDALRAQYHMISGLDRVTQRALDTDEELAHFRHGRVADYMDQRAMVKEPSDDLLGIAEAFLNSPYRRLPVVENGKLIGQISRRDLLEVAISLLRREPERETAKALYLSGVSHTIPPSLS